MKCIPDAGKLLGFLIVSRAAAAASPQGAEYPTRPVRIIVGSAPGGGLDSLSRSAAQMVCGEHKFNRKAAKIALEISANSMH